MTGGLVLTLVVKVEESLCVTCNSIFLTDEAKAIIALSNRRSDDSSLIVNRVDIRVPRWECSDSFNLPGTGAHGTYKVFPLIKNIKLYSNSFRMAKYLLVALKLTLALLGQKMAQAKI